MKYSHLLTGFLLGMTVGAYFKKGDFLKAKPCQAEEKKDTEPPQRDYMAKCFMASGDAL